MAVVPCYGTGISRRQALMGAAALPLGALPLVASPGRARAQSQAGGAATATAFRLADETRATNIKVHWQAVTGADRYEVHRACAGHPAPVRVATVTGTTLDDYALPAEQTYTYRIRALDVSGADLSTSSTNTCRTFTPGGAFASYDNTRKSSLSLRAGLEADGIYYRYDFRSDADGFSQVVEETSTDGYTFTGNTVVLSRDATPELQDSKLESVNVVKNPATGQFVMWAHYENRGDYTLAETAVAVARPGGAFTFLGHSRPLGHESRDLTFFADIDGTGYVISAARNNSDLNLYRLTPDWLAVAELSAVLFPDQHREAPALVQADGTYYLFSSEAAGWYPSQGKYASAPSTAGPWSELREIGNPATFGAQSGGIVEVGDRHAMMANRWSANWRYPEAANQQRMLPITFHDGYASYDLFETVDYDAEAGTLIPVQRGRIVSAGGPANASSLSEDEPGEDLTYEPAKANDGDHVSKENYYKSGTVPFTWEVDLRRACRVDRINITTRLVNGSETYYEYTIDASEDGRVYNALVDESANRIAGFKTHRVTDTARYRYVRLTVTRIVNIHNENTADWARGINELTVFGAS
ncbi:family 43 glycosylhydrolase [Streptomyces sp. NPDC058391]|uniref:family 43 glycosylhydrolase n=1 Tax=Streptomyces sp. NPDC058391 TaxID=3346476 RepID=UPI0036665606